MARMMTPGETNYRMALRNVGQRKYEFDTGLKADALRQAAQIAAQQRIADQQAEMQKWTRLAGLGDVLGAGAGAGVGALLTPSATAGLEQKADWLMKPENAERRKALGW